MRAEDQFIELLLAAMCDAAVEGKCTQLQTTITPPGTSKKTVRLVIIPEELDFVRSDGVGKFRRPT